MTSINLPRGARLTYIVGAEAWYRHTDPDQTPYLTVSAASDGGGCFWEFQIVEKDLGHGAPALQIKVFNDAWQAFDQVRPLFDALAAGGVDDLDGVRAVLDVLGAVDETARVSPYPQEDSVIVPIELSGRDLNQILTALENRGDETNGDPAMGTLVARLRTIAARLGR